jgi:hypothetical protein
MVCCGIHSKELYYYSTYLLLPWDESKNLMDIAERPLNIVMVTKIKQHQRPMS